MILIPATEPFVGLRGPDPILGLSRNQKTPPTTGPFSSDILVSKSHLNQYGGVMKLGFHTLREHMMWILSLRNRSNDYYPVK